MHLMAVKKSRKRYGFVIFSCFKRDWVHLQQLKEIQSSRCEAGVPFVNRMYTKGLPFLCKKVYKRVMGWTSGRRLPVWYFFDYPRGGGGGKGVSKEICGTVRLPVWRHISRQWLSKASKVFIEDTDKNFNFIMEILFRFLGFGDFKVPIVIKKKLDLSTFWEWNVQWWNEFLRFLSIVEQILRAIIPTGHTFEGQCTARLRILDTAIGGSWKDVLYFTLCVFSALQS